METCQQKKSSLRTSIKLYASSMCLKKTLVATSAWPAARSAAFAIPLRFRSKVGFRVKATDASCSWHICSFIYLIFVISLLPWKAAPYWLDKPTNLVFAPEENGRLVCRANGNPKPTIQWLMNGEPIESESTVFLVLTVGIIDHKAVMHTFFCSLWNRFTTKPKPASSWWHHHVPFCPDRQ